jgi:hypothetical protein
MNLTGDERILVPEDGEFLAHYALWCYNDEAYGDEIVYGSSGSSVPEPGSMALLGTALAGMAVGIRRCRARGGMLPERSASEAARRSPLWRGPPEKNLGTSCGQRFPHALSASGGISQMMNSVRAAPS